MNGFDKFFMTLAGMIAFAIFTSLLSYEIMDDRAKGIERKIEYLTKVKRICDTTYYKVSGRVDTVINIHTRW